MQFEQADVGLHDRPRRGGRDVEVFHTQAGEDRAAQPEAVDAQVLFRGQPGGDELDDRQNDRLIKH